MARMPSYPTLRTDYESYNNIRALQSLLNYHDNLELPLTGVYDTATYNAVVKYQRNHGLSADGLAGGSTLTSLVNGVTIRVGTSNNAARAAQFLLSKFESVSINGNYTQSTANVAATFQSKMGIASDGIIGPTSWQYLFGHYFYPSMGCDTATTITSARLQTLKNYGYGFVGRDLPGSNYPLSVAEKNIITSGGLFIVSIFEKGSPDDSSYFTESRGQSDAAIAIDGARSVGQPSGTPIYFAVDYNAPMEDISGCIRVYLQAIKAVFANNNYPYELGLYGSGALLNYFHNTYTYTMLAGASAWDGSKSYSQFCLHQFPTIELGNGSGYITVDPNESNGSAGGWN